jgi:hypothetical protein
MTISQNELQERVLLVLDQHLGLQDVPEVARSIMAEFIVSAVSAAKENRIGRAWDAEKSITAKKLEKIAQLLERLSKEMSDLNPLAKELLGREKGGFLPLSTHDLDHFYWAGTEMGDTSAVIEHISLLDTLRRSVDNSRAALEGKLKQFGRGQPPKDGALAVAQHCAAAFEEYVGPPTHSTWNDYSKETGGRFYFFVRDVFDVGGIEASAAEYAKQAVDFKRRSNLEKN